MAMSPRLLRPIQTGFDPRKIAGITAWFDASDDSVFTFNSGNVSEWRSKVGGYSATQAVALNQPTVVSNWRTSRRAVKFTASTQLLNLDATWNNLGNNTAKTITEFYALQWPTGSNQAFIQEPSALNNHKIFAYFANSQSYYDAGSESTARVFGNVGSGVTSGVVITGLRNDGVVTLRHNDTQVATRSDATGDLYGSIAHTIRFSGAGGGDAFLAQAITYSRALSTAEQSAVRAFLYQKYGL